MSPDSDPQGEPLESFARGFLEKQHTEHGLEPIRYPDESGRFPKPLLQRFVGRPLAIVADTNVLLGDCVTGYKKVGHTVLVTGANSGTFHVFCPEHVFNEVPEKCEEFCAKTKADPKRLLDCWCSKVVPKLRIVPTEAVQNEMLVNEERDRVEFFRTIDPDDIPAVQLSLTIGAVFLSKDPPAWKAVYGKEAENEILNKWVNVLIEGSNAGEMGTVAFMTSTLPAAAVVGTVQFFSWAVKKSLLITGLGLLAAAFGASRLPAEFYGKAWNVTKSAFAFAGNEIYAPYGRYLENFRKFKPPQPTWEEVGALQNRDAALTRACLYRLARAYEPLSARELADELPYLGIGQGEQRVRQILSGNSAFFKTDRGKWQVGWPSTHWKK
ncbi:MAG: PIN domain-containing protein [Vulcanimicrobiaceae bacterium]